MGRLSVDLCGIPLENPVIPASGTFGYGREFAELYDINCLGTFSFKGTTLQPRYGNPTPRIAEGPGGMLNAVGLQNPGVEAVIARELPRLKEVFHKPAMANVSGFSLEEYVKTCALLDRDELDGARAAGTITPAQHRLALREAEAVIAEFAPKPETLLRRCQALLSQLLPQLSTGFRASSRSMV